MLRMNIVAIIGLATALFAATIALKQNDIKKVLAYSTVSQLGYMFLALGVGAYTGAVFHVMTHAFFKALLFLGSGSVIHAMSGEQDIRNMGGLSKIHEHYSFHFPDWMYCHCRYSTFLRVSFQKMKFLLAAFAKARLLCVYRCYLLHC